MTRRTWPYLLLPLALLLAAPLPALAQLPPLTSEAEDARQGAQVHPQIVARFGGVYDDPKIGAYVAMVGARLLAASDQQGKEYTFTVLDSDIPNAFALPGGYAYVTRGMLALINTEAELAAVMGHEIGHVIARHSAQRQTGNLIAGLLAGAIGALTNSSDAAGIASMLGQGALAGYSRSQEYEADELGVRYMRAAGWNPLAAADMLSGLKRQSDLMQALYGRQGSAYGEFFATHPNTLERVGRAVELANQAGAAGDYGREAWLRATDGLMYGGSPQNGYARGEVFAHPELRITFTVPPDWVLRNGASQVEAVDPERGGAMVFDIAEQKRGAPDPYAYLRDEWLRGARLIQPGRANFDGLRGAVASVRLQGQDGTVRVAHVAAIELARYRYYRFLFVVDARTPVEPIGAAIRSFRRLHDDEVRRLRPWRIRVFTAGAGDGIASLSRFMAMPRDKEETFRVINALDAGASLRPGDKVKIVVEDAPR